MYTGQSIYAFIKYEMILFSSVCPICPPTCDVKHIQCSTSNHHHYNSIILFYRNTVWSTACIILTEKNNNIWSVANQFLKESFCSSNGCAFRKLIIPSTSADGNVSNLICCFFFSFAAFQLYPFDSWTAAEPV